MPKKVRIQKRRRMIVCHSVRFFSFLPYFLYFNLTLLTLNTLVHVHTIYSLVWIVVFVVWYLCLYFAFSSIMFKVQLLEQLNTILPLSYRNKFSNGKFFPMCSASQNESLSPPGCRYSAFAWPKKY